MADNPGRRERKKAATRERIAEAAVRLFLERGYENVGIREIADEADVAVTTVFSHFASKEALLFERDQDFEERLRRAVTERPAGEPLIPDLRREVHAMVRHCSVDAAIPILRLIDGSRDLREYEESMRLRHAESLAEAIAADPDRPPTMVACQAIARFVIDAFSVGRDAADPERAVDEIFEMIEAAWSTALGSRQGRGPDRQTVA